MEHDHQDGGLGTGRFRIWVQGRLDERFSEGLAGIELHDVPAGTMLAGELLDQSQLHSTLDLLRSLGINVLRFEVDPPPAPDSTDLASDPEASGEPVRHRLRSSEPACTDEGHEQE